MSSPSASLRKRGPAKRDVAEPVPSEPHKGGATARVVAAKPPSEWDYWVGMAFMTMLAFLTRFWNIHYPDEVVFDEVHFGKVCKLAQKFVDCC